MKTDEEWQAEGPMVEVPSGAVGRAKLEWIRAIQADALEAAEKILLDESETCPSGALAALARCVDALRAIKPKA